MVKILRILFICCLIRNGSGFCGGEPTGINVSARSASSAHVTWDVTKINCGYAISGYRVHFDSISPIVTFKEISVSGSTTDTVDIYPLVPAFTYKVYVMTLNENGEIRNPTSVNYTHPHTKPATAPPNIHASHTEITSLTLAWDALNIFTKNGNVQGYNVYYQGPGLMGTQHETAVGEATRELKISGLTSNSTYMFMLNVFNDVGPGPYSSRTYLTTLPFPSTTTPTLASVLLTTKLFVEVAFLSTKHASPQDHGITNTLAISPSITRDTTTTNVGLQRNQSERHDVSCNSDSMSVFIPSTLLSQNETLSWRDPHCTVTNNGTHYVSVVSHTACGTTVKFTDSEVIFENDLIIRQSTSLPVSSHNDIVDFGGAYSEIIPVKCVYPRRQNVTTAYIPAQTRVRFFEKRYGHMDVELEQYHSDKFDTVIRDITYPREVPINQDMYIKLHTIHNSSDIAIKVDSCVATPSIMPADGQLYPLIDHGCPASPAVKLYPSAFNEVKFSVHAFEFKSSPGSVVYIHCQISVCLAKNPQCVVGCRSRQRREVSAADDSSHLVSGGPYLLVAEQGSVQMATIVAAVCACLAVVATIVAAVGWRRKLNAPKHDSKLISD